MLMIRDTPGHASPTGLAQDLGVSPAGMTGRLDGLEKAGWVSASLGAEDRRRIGIEVTRAGAEIWRRAMALRGSAEEELVGALTPDEQRHAQRAAQEDDPHARGRRGLRLRSDDAAAAPGRTRGGVVVTLRASGPQRVTEWRGS